MSQIALDRVQIFKIFRSFDLTSISLSAHNISPPCSLQGPQFEFVPTAWSIQHTAVRLTMKKMQGNSFQIWGVEREAGKGSGEGFKKLCVTLEKSWLSHCLGHSSFLPFLPLIFDNWLSPNKSITNSQPKISLPVVNWSTQWIFLENPARIKIPQGLLQRGVRDQPQLSVLERCLAYREGCKVTPVILR